MPNTEPHSDVVRLQAEVEALRAQLATAEIRLKQLAITDPITGLYSYRYLLGRVTEEAARADRFGLEVSCLMLGLDRVSFEGMLEVAKMLKDACRQYDVPARWGQKELVLLLPATDLEGAQTFGERFRLKVEAHFRTSPVSPGLTVSCGIATYPRPGLEDAQQLVEAADTALFKAGQEGGNRTVLRQ